MQDVSNESIFRNYVSLHVGCNKQAWENEDISWRHFRSPRETCDVWGTTAKIPNWWRVLLIGRAASEIGHLH